MDSEPQDKSNNCETSESAVDSSSINNNNVLKDGVKKVLSANNINAEKIMEDNGEENTNTIDRISHFERENGIRDETKENEKQTDEQTNNEITTPNHEQLISNKSVNNEESDSEVQNEQKCESKKGSEGSENIEQACNANKQSEKKHENDCDSASADVEKMEVDASENNSSNREVPPTSSSEKPESEKGSSEKPNVRPIDKDPNIASDLSTTEENSSKKDSSDKGTKESSSSEVSIETSSSKEETKGKETIDKTPSKSKEADGVSSENKEVNDKAPAESKETNDNAPSESKKTNSSTQSESKPESTKKEGESSKKKKSKTCEECGARKGLKFQVLFKGKTRFLCSDTCFKNFKTKQMQSKSSESAPPSTSKTKQAPAEKDKCSQCQKDIPADQGLYPVVGDAKPLCSEDCLKKYQSENMPTKSCSQCKKVIENLQHPDVLTWETMLYCNEDCLGKYQSYLGSHCTCCQSPVPQASLGKYSVCFGADIRQFCSCSCLDEFKKNLKVCSFCQTDLSAGVDSFLAPVGDKGQFKDFCSQNCMERYEVMNNISKSTPQTQVCTHCKKQGTFKIQVKHENQSYSLCSDLCVAGFRCSNKIKDKMCDTCYNFFYMAPDKDFSFKFDGHSKQFCTKACMTLFVLSHRKIVACVSCKVKKYNFDMIEKTDSNNQTQIFCSLNCLSMYRVTVNATSSKSVRCDHCGKNLPAQYHLTMSDGSVRNFCTYNCVIVFQNQYTNVCTLTTTSTTRQTSASTSTSKTTTATSAPMISNVVSLAPATGQRNPGPTLIRNLVPPKLVPARQPIQPLAIIGSKIYSLAPSTRAVTPVLTTLPSQLDADQQHLQALMVSNDSKPASSTVTTAAPLGTVTNASGQQVIREVIVKPPAPKSQKNKSVACKPIMLNKGINVKPQPCHKAVQTDDSPRQILLPVPVPIYIPTPLHMFSRPVPCPMPFPVPIPIPIMIPSSKALTSQERLPSNEIENSLYTIPENAAEEACSTRNDVSSEEHNSQRENNCESETALNAEPCSSNTSDELNDSNEMENDDEYVFKDGKSHHHGKRHSSHHKSKSRKRSKTDEVVVEEAKAHNIAAPEDNLNSAAPNDQPEPVPRLKYTFGVNAWKQWVLHKNDQIKGSQSSRKFKLFKTDLLTLPPDELNYSLSLFVKEVRKPSGEEYGSGSIYYLCLGIQKYLYENGRLDNIFSDPYYEKFTECLNDILQSQDTLSMLEGYPSSRIDEEILWEAKQLGAHSPYALLNTLMYFNTKYFKLKTVEDHSRLSFTHIETLPKEKNPQVEKNALRYYPKEPRKDSDTPYYEQRENAADSMRCPVKLYEFYQSKMQKPNTDSDISDTELKSTSDNSSKSHTKRKVKKERPSSCKNRNDMFYLSPERSCVPDSSVWYSSQALGHDVIAKMIQRIKIVREIYEN